MKLNPLVKSTAAGFAFSAMAFSAQAEGKLNIYNWAGYTPPELVEKFAAENGVEVTIDTYDTNETLLAKLQAGGGDYDIIVTGHTFIPIFVREGLIQDIDPSTLSNFSHIDERFKNPSWDPDGKFSMPYQWGTTSFAVDTSAYDTEIDSLGTLFEPPSELEGKIGMFKNNSDLMAMAELYLGIPFCTEDPADMQKVLDLLMAQKPAVKTYSGAAAMREQMVSGEIAIMSTYSGQAQRARRVKDSVAYVYPKEGVLAWVDVIAVPSGAQNFENARKFIDFLLLPESAGALSNHAGYANGSVGSLEFMNEDLINSPELNVPEGIPTVAMESCSPEAVELETQALTQLLQ